MCIQTHADTLHSSVYVCIGYISTLIYIKTIKL